MLMVGSGETTTLCCMPTLYTFVQGVVYLPFACQRRARRGGSQAGKLFHGKKQVVQNILVGFNMKHVIVFKLLPAANADFYYGTAVCTKTSQLRRLWCVNL